MNFFSSGIIYYNFLQTSNWVRYQHLLSLVIVLTCLLGSSYFWMFKFYCPFFKRHFWRCMLLHTKRQVFKNFALFDHARLPQFVLYLYWSWNGRRISKSVHKINCFPADQSFIKVFIVGYHVTSSKQWEYTLLEKTHSSLLITLGCTWLYNNENCNESSMRKVL